MLTSVRSLLAATVLRAALAATPAMAQDDEERRLSPSPETFRFVTDYRFRGIGLSGGDPAIQGGLTATTSPGIYVGAWRRASTMAAPVLRRNGTPTCSPAGR